MENAEVPVKSTFYVSIICAFKSIADSNSLLCLWFIFQVKGTVFSVDAYGALVDITAKSSAYLPPQEACIHRIKHVNEAGIVPGLREEFVIIGENESDDSLILSLRSMQYDLAWERCRQLQTEDVIIKGKVGTSVPSLNNLLYVHEFEFSCCVWLSFIFILIE